MDLVQTYLKRDKDFLMLGVVLCRKQNKSRFGEAKQCCWISLLVFSFKIRNYNIQLEYGLSEIFCEKSLNLA